MEGQLACTEHPSRNATFRCPPCSIELCEACAEHITVQGRSLSQCPRCEAILVAARPLGPRPGPRAYLGRLGEFCAFPVRRDVLFILLGMAVLVAPLMWALSRNVFPHLALLGMLIVAGLEMSIYLHLVIASAHGSDSISPPDFSDPVSDFGGPLIRYLAAAAPLVIAVFLLGSELGSYTRGLVLFDERPTAVFDYPAPAIAAVVGIALLPLLTIIAASGTLVSVLNPLVWIRSLRVVIDTYPIATLAFYAVFAVETLIWLPLLAELRAEFSIPFVTSVVTLAMSYLPLALRARLLGGLVEPYFARLGDR